MVPLHTIDRVRRDLPQLNEAQRIRWGPMDQVCAVRPWCVLCPVSYTHLDVYKRQEPTPRSSSITASPPEPVQAKCCSPIAVCARREVERPRCASSRAASSVPDATSGIVRPPVGCRRHSGSRWVRRWPTVDHVIWRSPTAQSTAISRYRERSARR